MRHPRELRDGIQHVAAQEQHSAETSRQGFGPVGGHSQFLGTGQAVSHRLQFRDADRLYRPAAMQTLLRDGRQVRAGRLPAGDGPEALKHRLPRPRNYTISVIPFLAPSGINPQSCLQLLCLATVGLQLRLVSHVFLPWPDPGEIREQILKIAAMNILPLLCEPHSGLVMRAHPKSSFLAPPRP